MVGRVERRARNRGIARSVGYWLLLLPLAFVTFVPMWDTLVAAFATPPQQFASPMVWWPTPITLENFQAILTDERIPMARWFWNSLLVSTVGTLLVLAVCAPAGYGYARLRFPGKDAIFALLVFGLMVPLTATLIPVFIMLRRVGVLDTYGSIWFPAMANILGVFLLRQAFYAIPVELEDAARVDGANRLRIFGQIALPLVQGSLTALAIFTFFALWNDTFWPLIVLSERIRMTLPVGLLMALEGFYGPSGYGFAAALTASLPPLLLYAFFQRRIMAGMVTVGLAGQ